MRQVHASLQRDARLARAQEAWLRVSTFKDDRIPPGLSGQELHHYYAQLIVELGTVLREDGWQAQVDGASPGTEDKTFAITILRKAIEGDLETVKLMVTESSSALWFGLSADGWLRDGLRYEVLEIEPDPNSIWASRLPSRACKLGTATLEERAPSQSPRSQMSVADYLVCNPKASLEDTMKATRLSQKRIERMNVWKKHQDGLLRTYLHDHPDATTDVVRRAMGWSPAKIAGMPAWKEHQAIKKAAKPGRPLKERPLSKSIIKSKADDTAADPTAPIEHRDQIYRAIIDSADPPVRAKLHRLGNAARKDLLDYLLKTLDGEAGPRLESAI
jgi:hypothetical protein